MKIYILTIVSCFFLSSAFAQSKKQVSDSTVQVMEAACGKCMFGMKDKECSLAVRTNGKAYHVAGASIDDFGDAHNDDGFCNAIRKAAVTGHLKKNVFKVTSFKLLALE